MRKMYFMIFRLFRLFRVFQTKHKGNSTAKQNQCCPAKQQSWLAVKIMNMKQFEIINKNKFIWQVQLKTNRGLLLELRSELAVIVAFFFCSYLYPMILILKT